jgi:ABC-type dipeptide/oligopeptide/nickel transport system permease subunit
MTGTIALADVLWLMLIAWVAGAAAGYFSGRQDGYVRGALAALQRLREVARG